MSDPIRLDGLTDAQVRRVICLRVACALFPGSPIRTTVADWLYTGKWKTP